MEELVAAARDRGLDVHVLMAGEDPAELARESAHAASAIGIAGGDGSLAPVAGVAVETETPFVCIPFGTRNHLAQDLGLDADDPIACLAAYEGTERRLDIGRAADRWFVNNVSLGLYASFVHDPARKTRNRLVALFRLLPAALGRTRAPLDLSLEVEGEEEHRSALLLLVANNGYTMRTLSAVGARRRLDEGRLHAYVIEAVSRRALLALLGRAFLGSLEEAEGWSEWSAASLRIDASRDHLHATVDGEAALLPAPLQVEVRPRALRILVPRRPAE